MLQPAVTATETNSSRRIEWILVKIIGFCGKGWMGFACVLERSPWKMLFEDDNCFSSQMVTEESFGFFLLSFCLP